MRKAFARDYAYSNENLNFIRKIMTGLEDDRKG